MIGVELNRRQPICWLPRRITKPGYPPVWRWLVFNFWRRNASS